MAVTQKNLLDLVSGLATVTAQNEEIIRRLNIQNGRVDKLEDMQWRIIVYIAGAVGGVEVLTNVLFA